MEILITIIILLFAILLGAFGSLYFKIGAEKLTGNFSDLMKNFALIKGAILYGTSALFYIIALKGGELSVLYPLVATGYIVVCLLSVRFLHEKMNQEKWLGIALIILGVSLIGLGSV